MIKPTKKFETKILIKTSPFKSLTNNLVDELQLSSLHPFETVLTFFPVNEMVSYLQLSIEVEQKR
jgi:hypothetical protein